MVRRPEASARENVDAALREAGWLVQDSRRAAITAGSGVAVREFPLEGTGSLFWLRDESLEDSANLPPPDVIAAEIVEDLRTALEQFESIQADLPKAS